MIRSPAIRSVYETPNRDGEKQTRAADGTQRVRVVDSVGRLVAVIYEERAIAKYLAAPNARSIRDRRGRLRAIRLTSVGDDRGDPGEHNGTSLVTTERCKTDAGEYIGAPMTLKHKWTAKQCDEMQRWLAETSLATPEPGQSQDLTEGDVRNASP
jgi:hypothetical protein